MRGSRHKVYWAEETPPGMKAWACRNAEAIERITLGEDCFLIHLRDGYFDECTGRSVYPISLEEAKRM